MVLDEVDKDDEGREVTCTLGPGLEEMMFDRVGVTGERVTGSAYGGGADAKNAVSGCVGVVCACICAVGSCGAGCEPGSARLISGEPFIDGVATGRCAPPGWVKYELSRGVELE